MRPRSIETERIDALADAIETWRRETTAAELLQARADAKMVEALATARTEGKNPIPWRTIGQLFEVTHQAAISKWRTVVDETIAAKSPSQRKSDPLRSTRLNRTTNGDTA